MTETRFPPSTQRQKVQSPIEMSAVLVSYNEGRHLGACLGALDFCSEIIVVDLGSTDDSCEIARRMGARVLLREWVPYAPLVRSQGIEATQNDWVVSIDPDMILPDGSYQRAVEMITDRTDLAIIQMSYQNYFKGKAVRYGRWGGVLPFFPTFVNKERVVVETREHRGHFSPKAGYSAVSMPVRDGLILRHNWVDSLEELEEKLKRYTSGEVEARVNESRSNSIVADLWRTLRGVLDSLVLKRGVLQGWLGVRLALMSARYEWRVQRGVAANQKGRG